MRKTNPVPDSIPAFIKLYGILIAFFTLFRLALFFTEIGSVHSVLNKQDVLLSFLMGLRFDVVISGYILLLPFALVSLAALLNYRQKAVLKFSFYYTAIISSLRKAARVLVLTGFLHANACSFDRAGAISRP